MPVTMAMRKELLPITDKLIIQYAVEEAVAVCVHPLIQSRQADPRIIRNLTLRKPTRQRNPHRILAKLIRPACANG